MLLNNTTFVSMLDDKSMRVKTTNNDYQIITPDNPLYEAMLQLYRYEQMCKPIPIEDYHEDYGDCLFWTIPVIEPPYVGSTIDSCFDAVHKACNFTHFTRLIEPIEQTTDNE